MCSVCIRGIQTQEKFPRACPHYIFHGFGLISLRGPCFPTLSTHQSPAQRPRFQQLSRRTSWYSLAPAVEKQTSGAVPQTFSSQHPFYGSRGAQSKSTLQSRLGLPQLFFQRAGLYFPLPSLILGFCSSEATSLGTVKTQGRRVR